MTAPVVLPHALERRLDRSSPHGCWLWTGRLDADGYGRVDINGKSGRKAHRVVYELVKGPIPAGLVLMHSCDHLHRGTEGRRCCAPDHLTPGTTRENAEDRSRKGRSARQREPRGPGWMTPGRPPGRRYW